MLLLLLLYYYIIIIIIIIIIIVGDVRIHTANVLVMFMQIARMENLDDDEEVEEGKKKKRKRKGEEAISGDALEVPIPKKWWEVST